MVFSFCSALDNTAKMDEREKSHLNMKFSEDKVFGEEGIALRGTLRMIFMLTFDLLGLFLPVF